MQVGGAPLPHGGMPLPDGGADYCPSPSSERGMVCLMVPSLCVDGLLPIPLFRRGTACFTFPASLRLRRAVPQQLGPGALSVTTSASIPP